MRTIFGFETEGLDRLDDQSVYLYYLPPPDTPEDAAAVAAEPASEAQKALVAQLSPHLHSAPGGGAPQRGSFRPNLTVTRTATARSLETIVDERRRDVLAQAPFALVNEGPTRVAGQAAHEAEYRISLTEPAIILMQLQVTTVIEGYAYSFIATSTSARWEADRACSQTIISSLR